MLLFYMEGIDSNQYVCKSIIPYFIMKNLILLFLILFSSFSFAQENIKGMFHRPPEEMSFNADYLEFKDNARFKYHTYGCMTFHTKGEGAYKLEDDKIILKFDKAETKQYGEIHTENINTDIDKDSIVLKFKVMDYSKMVIPGVNLNLMSESMDKPKTYGTNFHGEVIIYKAKNSDKTKYELAAVGFQSFQFELSNASSKSIEVFLSTPQPRAISEETYQYEVEHFYNDSIILKDGTKFTKIEK